MSSKATVHKIIMDAIQASITPATEAAREIFEQFIIIPKAELPTVKRSTHDENTYYTDRENVVFTSVDNAKMWCLRDIAVWQFIASEGAARDKRREEISAELGCPGLYPTLIDTAPMRVAIDRIIELEASK